jgi:flagellar motor component MotA
VFLVIKQLPSGDLCFQARSASGAEVLRRHADAWVQAFRKTAYVRMPTWGVVAHGIPVASICKDGADITSELGHDMAVQLVAAN